MLTAMEVVALFKIKDEATDPIRRIAAEAKKLSDQLKVLTDQGIKVGDTMKTVFTNMGSGVGAATAEVRTLAAEWAKVERAALAAGAAARTGGVATTGPTFRRGVHPGGGGIHVPPVALPGGASASFGNNFIMAGVGAGLYGGWLEGQLDSQARQAVYIAHQGQEMPKKDVLDRERAQFIQLVKSVSTETGVPMHDVGEALTTDIRQGKGFSWDQRLGGARSLLTTAAQEAQLKGVSYKESSEALIGFAHMLKEYDPTNMTNIYPELQYLATSSPASLAKITRAAGYHIPATSALGVNPLDELILQTGLERAGISNTKSGTWLREMARGALVPEMDIVGKEKYDKKMRELKELGLVDEAGKSTWFHAGQGGKPDELKMLQQIAEAARHIAPERMFQLERSLMGAQGAGAVGTLADPRVLPQLETMREEIRNIKKGAAETYFSQDMKDNPLLQFNRSLREADTVLMQLGQHELPVFLGAMRGVNTLLAPLTMLTGPMGEKGRAFAEGGTYGGVIGGGINPASSLMWGSWEVMKNVLGLDKPVKELGGDAAKAAGNLGWFDRVLKSIGAGAAPPALPGKQSYNVLPMPDNSTARHPHPVKLDIDGRSLAQVMSTRIARLYEFPSSAPFHDGGRSFASNDMQTTMT